MAFVDVSCPHCRQHVSLDDALLGQVVVCPHCKNTFQTLPPPPSADRAVLHIHKAPKTAFSERGASIFNFKHFVTPKAADVIWRMHLVFATLDVVGGLVLFTILLVLQKPIIELNTKTIRKDTAEVTVENSGDGTAKDVRVYLDIPKSASIVGIQPSSANYEIKSLRGGDKRVAWTLAGLEAGTAETLAITVSGEASFDVKVAGFRREVSQTLGLIGKLWIGHLVILFFYLLNLRLVLEAALILFRMEEHLRCMREMSEAKGGG